MNRVFAALYDRAMSGVEHAGLSEWRHELLAGLEGRVLEIGAGTGSNLRFYPPAVEELVLAEPDRNMRSRLAAVLQTVGGRATIIDAAAEHIPYPDAYFDAVVSTLVLCSVGHPTVALAELRRVLRPEGRLVLIEHVHAPPGTSAARWQKRLEPLWKRVAGNCHLTRDTAAAIAAANFDATTLKAASMRKAAPIIRPTIRGIVSRNR